MFASHQTFAQRKSFSVSDDVTGRGPHQSLSLELDPILFRHLQFASRCKYATPPLEMRRYVLAVIYECERIFSTDVI